MDTDPWKRVIILDKVDEGEAMAVRHGFEQTFLDNIELKKEKARLEQMASILNDAVLVKRKTVEHLEQSLCERTKERDQYQQELHQFIGFFDEARQAAWDRGQRLETVIAPLRGKTQELREKWIEDTKPSHQRYVVYDLELSAIAICDILDAEKGEEMPHGGKNSRPHAGKIPRRITESQPDIIHDESGSTCPSPRHSVHVHEVGCSKVKDNIECANCGKRQHIAEEWWQLDLPDEGFKVFCGPKCVLPWIERRANELPDIPVDDAAVDRSQEVSSLGSQEAREQLRKVGRLAHRAIKHKQLEDKLEEILREHTRECGKRGKIDKGDSEFVADILAAMGRE